MPALQWVCVLLPDVNGRSKSWSSEHQSLTRTPIWLLVLAEIEAVRLRRGCLDRSMAGIIQSPGQWRGLTLHSHDFSAGSSNSLASAGCSLATGKTMSLTPDEIGESGARIDERRDYPDRRISMPARTDT